MPITEQQLVVPALRAMVEHGGYIATARLIDELAEHFGPYGKDAEIAKNRSDTYFSQKVRNLISHRGNFNSMFSRGLAEYLPEFRSLRITTAGRDYLERIKMNQAGRGARVKAEEEA